MTKKEAIEKIRELMNPFYYIDEGAFERCWEKTTIGEVKETWIETNNLIRDINSILDEVEE